MLTIEHEIKLNRLEKEKVPPCIVCGKVWQRYQACDKWIYHDSKGVVCTSHKGVSEWYDEMLINRERINSV